MKAILLGIICFTFSTAVFSQTIQLVSIDYPPYVYQENGKIKGFNVDLLKEIFQRMKTPMEIELMPWARAVKMIRRGQADALFPFFKNEERLKFTDYPESFTEEPVALFVIKESPIQWNGDLRQLSQYRFGRVRGYSSGSTFDQALEDGIIQLDETSSTRLNIKKLLLERFEIMIENKYVALYELQKMNAAKNIRELEPLIQNNLAYLGFSKKRNHKVTIDKFNTTLREMKEDGSYQKIIDNFFGK